MYDDSGVFTSFVFFSSSAHAYTHIFLLILCYTITCVSSDRGKKNRKRHVTLSLSPPRGFDRRDWSSFPSRFLHRSLITSRSPFSETSSTSSSTRDMCFVICIYKESLKTLLRANFPYDTRVIYITYTSNGARSTIIIHTESPPRFPRGPRLRVSTIKNSLLGRAEGPTGKPDDTRRVVDPNGEAAEEGGRP